MGAGGHRARLGVRFEGVAAAQLDLDEEVVADDGPAAVAALRQLTPDIALVDIGLPGMDGYEVARRVRQELGNTELRMVAITGYGQASDRQAAAAAGFDAHLTKPLKPRDLLHLLRILLGRGQPATR